MNRLLSLLSKILYAMTAIVLYSLLVMFIVTKKEEFAIIGLLVGVPAFTIALIDTVLKR